MSTILKAKETLYMDIPLATLKKVNSLLRIYRELESVMEDAVNVLTRGPNVQYMLEIHDLMIKVTKNHNLTLSEWLQHIKRTFTTKELEQLYILEVIQSMESKEITNPDDMTEALRTLL